MVKNKQIIMHLSNKSGNISREIVSKQYLKKLINRGQIFYKMPENNQNVYIKKHVIEDMGSFGNVSTVVLSIDTIAIQVTTKMISLHCKNVFF